MRTNLLGSYGEWASTLTGDAPGILSLRNPQYSDIASWRRAGREKLHVLVLMPVLDRRPAVNVVETYEYDGLYMEKLRWQFPYGPPTEAVFMKPAGSEGKLPGILALHDHGGVKYFGKRKIIRMSKKLHPHIREHQREYYGNRAWANEIAKKGYGVLVHDVFPFGSRRFMASDLQGYAVKRMMTPPHEIAEVAAEDLISSESVYDYEVGGDENSDHINRYNSFGEQHEHVIAKALFSSGLTWPGMFIVEDLFALHYLCSRFDIDAAHVGCCGLSGGGLRTNLVAGLDDRVKCSVTVGFMTTWRDFALNVNYTHTWMTYIPGLPRYLDYPEILGLRAPLPSMVLATDNDPLYTLDEVKRAAAMLREVYARTGASDAFVFNLHEGPHKFDLPMQNEAFNWFDRWLKPMP